VKQKLRLTIQIEGVQVSIFEIRQLAVVQPRWHSLALRDFLASSCSLATLGHDVAFSRVVPFVYVAWSD